MTEPIQTTPTSEPPEPPSDDVRASLTAMADRLTRRRPNSTMHEPMRMALALTHATDRKGFCTPEADTLEAQILARAPRVEADITRGEYALLLRKAADPR